MHFITKKGQPSPLGVSVDDWGINVAVLAPRATAIYFCVFDKAGKETRILLPTRTGGVHHGSIEQLDFPIEGLHYGLRADGEYDPSRGLFYDVNKLLVDPYAIEIDRSFVYDDALAAPKPNSIDTATLVPKAVFHRAHAEDDVVFSEHHPVSKRPEFIYELPVKAFTQLHPDVPEHLRGTIAALREPCVIEHLLKLGVDTVELMPITAWVNERHLQPLGLRNAWGYNPVAMMVPEPSLCPNGWRDVRETVTALKAVGIQTILDVVFNHTAESDVFGPTLSLRGLDNLYYYKHTDTHQLINDTGCGNTIDCEHEGVARLMVDTMRHWMLKTGVAGFRFDLAPVMGRLSTGFSKDAPFLRMINEDPLLSKALLIAEPWDIGVGGYQLGQFPYGWYEWNDKYRDDVRRFWQGQSNTLGGLATRLAGSSDIFQASGRSPNASINFLAAHDGFTLRDLVSYSHKYNDNNGEHNRDGSNDNHSWSNGVEGELPADAPSEEARQLKQRRDRDIRALLATLFVSQGTVMLTAGDEFGRTQRGNNNAYAQDNEVTWLDWKNKDDAMIDFVSGLAGLRRSLVVLQFEQFLTGMPQAGQHVPDVQWRLANGHPVTTADWFNGHHSLGVALFSSVKLGQRVFIWLNAGDAANVTLPEPRQGHEWYLICDSASGAFSGQNGVDEYDSSARSVQVWMEL